LDCSFNNIENLDFLSESLIYLDCSYNNIRDLSNLPIGIKKLNYESNLKKKNTIPLRILPKKVNLFYKYL